MAEIQGNIEVPGGQIGSGQAQVFDGRQSIAYLQNARNRADLEAYRRAQLAQQEKELAAREAKKAQEEEVVAKFDIAKGNDFDRIVQDRTRNLIGATKQIFMDPMAKAVQKKQANADANFLIGSMNEWSAAQKAKFDATEKALNPYYNTPATNRVKTLDELATQAGDKFFMHDFTQPYAESIRNNPANYNWNSAGNILISKQQALNESIKNASGTGNKSKWSQFYTGARDKTTGLPVIDYKVAQQIADTDPEVQHMMATYTKSIEPELIAQHPNASGKDIQDTARKLALDKLFQGKGVFDVEVDNQSTQAAKAAQNRADKLSDVEVTPVGVTRRLSFNDPNSTGRVVRDSQNYGRADAYQLTKGAVDIGANKTVYLMNKPDNAPAGMFQPNGDGSYQTGFGFTTKTWDKLKDGAYILTDDIRATDKKGDPVTYPKGTPVDLAFGSRIAKKYPNRVQKIQAYILSPTRMQTVETDDPEVAQFLKNPAMKDVEVIIPVNQANEFAPYEKGRGGQTKGIGGW